MKKYYTGAGDDGDTGLLGEGRVKKYDSRMETLGTLDELSAFLGTARSLCYDSNKETIKKIQVQLYQLMSEIAATRENQVKYRKISDATVRKLEIIIDKLSEGLPPSTGFIIPGDTQPAAAFSIARAVCRRAERRVVELFDAKIIENNNLLKYLNRLSSVLYVMELKEASSITGEPTQAKESN